MENKNIQRTDSAAPEGTDGGPMGGGGALPGTAAKGKGFIGT